MSHNLNSLKGGLYRGEVILYGTTIGVTKGDTRSLDYSPYSKPGYPHYLPTY